VRADTLVILTGVDKVYADYGTSSQRALDRLSVAEATELLPTLDLGSMGPKVEACIEFVTHGGSRAVITSLDKVVDAVFGSAGTEVTAGNG
jgi:carbamate kinase